MVIDARSEVRQTWETLNRLLHRDQGTRVALNEASFDEPFIMTRAAFDQLIRSPADYAKFSNFYIGRALGQAPELEQLNAQIAAKEREFTTTKRAYWLPDFTIGGRYTENFAQSGAGTGPAAGEGLDDWSIGVQATLPIFTGGLKKANVSRADYELRQLKSLRISTEEHVDEEEGSMEINPRNGKKWVRGPYKKIVKTDPKSIVPVSLKGYGMGRLKKLYENTLRELGKEMNIPKAETLSKKSLMSKILAKKNTRL